MILHSLYHLGVVVLLYLLIKKLVYKDMVVIYEGAKNAKSICARDGYSLYKRLFLKTTGNLLSVTEYIYFLLLYCITATILAMIPFYESLVNSSGLKQINEYGLIVMLLLLFILSVMLLLPPKRLLIALGKEYFATKAITQIFVVFIVFVMAYMYGTFRLSEIIIYQSTKGLLGLTNWGILLNPILFLCYLMIVIYGLKANAKIVSIEQYNKDIDIIGLRTLFSIYTEMISMTHLVLIVTMFLGGYSLPYIDQLIDLDVSPLKVILQTTGVVLKTVVLLTVVKYIRREIVLKSDYRLNRYKMMVIYPLILAGLLALPIIHYIGG